MESITYISEKGCRRCGGKVRYCSVGDRCVACKVLANQKRYIKE